ncbi:acyltransferase family protein [Falsihalocynthiibacter arcticus]|uniref:Acyltransferase n=1 Tax=Falsihalocynthiibacter arcticus TaxID=1579316 RepID=A0A126V1I7_9RHOB|nr:acyltransferase family protein [Falsihalocynthiibacter arcticus]AML52192.1 hypothetical protein RC74_13735 [Falsihalocynthiibacter arcticus]
MKYRPEIDGLRAIAVLAVIVYHADNTFLRGGFLGVDVFFVISGFLISQLIAEDLRLGRFTFRNFYERRARRILPALFVVLATCIPFALAWMLPSQLADFGKGLVAASLFSSNFLFWSDTGYFMADADLNPLLHTWSLAVEEQFYLFFPLAALLAWKVSQRFAAILLVASMVASFAACLYFATSAPAANFYLLPTRAWELLAGGISMMVARQFAQKPVTVAKPVATILATLGLFAVISSLLLLDASTPVPSLSTLPLVVGTSLILVFAVGNTPVASLLSWRPLVAMGLISYSAYLWHLPVLVFARLYDSTPPSIPYVLGLIALSILLATLTYHFVEKPFRKRNKSAVISLRGLVSVLLGAGVSLAVVGVVLAMGLTNPHRDPSVFSDPEIEAKLATNYGLSEDCEGAFTLSPNCRTSDTPGVLLWGDSFSMHLAEAIEVGTKWQGMVQHTKSVCAPIPGLSVVTPEYPDAWARGCLDFNEQVLAWLADQPSIKYVVMSSPFGLIYNELLLANGEHVTEGQQELVRQSLLETSRKLKAMGKSLVVVSPPPVTGENIGQCLAATLRSGRSDDSCDYTRSDFHPASTAKIDFLRTLDPEISVLYLEDFLCPNGVCDTMIGSTFMFRDDGHLSIEGSRYLGTHTDFMRKIIAKSNLGYGA